MSRVGRFWLTSVLALLSVLLVLAGIDFARRFYLGGANAQVQSLVTAGMLLAYMLITLQTYLFMSQFFPGEDDPEIDYQVQEAVIVRSGSIMLIVSLSLVVLSYLNVWAAPAVNGYLACTESGATDCTITTNGLVALVTRYIGAGGTVLSLPVLLVGLIVNGIPGWD